MSDEDLHQRLARVADEFNLGQYEIEAYLAVLQHGELTASEMAAHTEVPQPRVYDTVRSLGERGLVELHESRPMKIVAVDPEEAFEGLQSSLVDLVDALESAYTASTDLSEAMSLVTSRSTIRRYVGDVIESAEYELTLSLTPSLLREFEDSLVAALDAGVSVELVVTPAAEAPDPEAFDYSRVATTVRARRGITTPVIVVADGRYAVYATQDAIETGDDRYGVIFNRSTLGFLLLGFFGTVIWTTADDVLWADDADAALPRRYASIRRCVKAIHDREHVVYVSIDGRDVETGESRVVVGRVADTHISEDEEVAWLVVETADGEVSVGGRVASYEDVEAHEIQVSRDPFE